MWGGKNWLLRSDFGGGEVRLDGRAKDGSVVLISNYIRGGSHFYCPPDSDRKCWEDDREDARNRLESSGRIINQRSELQKKDPWGGEWISIWRQGVMVSYGEQADYFDVWPINSNDASLVFFEEGAILLQAGDCLHAFQPPKSEGERYTYLGEIFSNMPLKGGMFVGPAGNLWFELQKERLIMFKRENILGLPIFELRKSG